MLLVTNVIQTEADTYTANIKFRDRRNITKIQEMDIIIDPSGQRFVVESVLPPKVQGMEITIKSEVPGVTPNFSNFYDADIEEYTDIRFEDQREEYVVQASDVGVNPLTIEIPNGVSYVPGSGDLEVYLNGNHLLKGNLSNGYILQEVPGSISTEVVLDGSALTVGDSILFVKERVRKAGRFVR